MEPPRTSSYYIEQVEREKERMLNEISDTDNNSTPYPDTDEDELDGTSVATFEKVSLEVQVLLGQVKKLSKNAEAREKKRAFAIKNLKMDMRLVRDTLANTKPIQIIWPIRDLEKFKELDENIEMNSIHADQLVIFYIKTLHNFRDNTTLFIFFRLLTFKIRKDIATCENCFRTRSSRDIQLSERTKELRLSTVLY